MRFFLRRPEIITEHRMKENRKYITLLLPELRGGGAEKVFLLLAREFVAKGFMVDLVLARRDGELLQEVPQGVRLVPLRAKYCFGRLTLALTLLPCLIHYLRTNRPDVMMSTLKGTNLVAVLAHSLALVSTRLVLREASTLENARNPFYLTLMRWFYPCADAVVVLTPHMKNQMEKHLMLQPDKVISIANPTNIERIKKEALEPLPSDFDSSQPYAVAVGSLTPQKDYMTMLKAFRDLLPCRIKLIILGTGPERPAIEVRIRELSLEDRIELRGFDHNPYRWMARAAIFVQTSRWEGMPNTVLEARALGIPIVMTEYDPSAREVGGQSAILVPVGNVKALVEAMSRVSFERPAEEPRLPQKVMEAHSAYLRVMDLERRRTDDDPSNQ